MIYFHILKIFISTSIINDPKLSSPAQIKQNVYQFELKNINGLLSNYLNDDIIIILFIPE
jgi:hypothetical protein